MCTAILCGLTLAAVAADPKPEAADKDQMAKLRQQYQNEIVIIRGNSGSGTGFIGNVNGKKFLFSNAHVLAGVRSPTFTLANRKPLKLGPASVAIGHDLVMMVVIEGSEGIPVAKPLDADVSINDDIMVLGNPGAGEVVTAVEGKLAGVGPNRVEVSAGIERGNSGSPVIHLKSGKVVGVASDVRTDQLLNGDLKLRRYGYRLDSVQQWQAIEWKRFYLEADLTDKLENTTSELIKAVTEISSQRRFSPLSKRRFAYESPAIRGAVDSFYQTMASESRDGRTAVRSLVASLQSASKGDVSTANLNLTYDYFRRRLTDEITTRGELMKDLATAVEK